MKLEVVNRYLNYADALAKMVEYGADENNEVVQELLSAMHMLVKEKGIE